MLTQLVKIDYDKNLSVSEPESYVALQWGYES